jgi:hypothetical protein
MQDLPLARVVPGPLAHSIRLKRLKPYRVRAYHDDCGGELIGTELGTPVNTMIGSAPWKHRCEKCGALGFIRGANYPMITYEE